MWKTWFFSCPVLSFTFLFLFNFYSHLKFKIDKSIPQRFIKIDQLYNGGRRWIYLKNWVGLQCFTEGSFGAVFRDGFFILRPWNSKTFLKTLYLVLAFVRLSLFCVYTWFLRDIWQGASAHDSIFKLGQIWSIRRSRKGSKMKQILACFWMNFTFHFNGIFRCFIRTQISTKAENNTFLLFHSVASVWWKNSTSK